MREFRSLVVRDEFGAVDGDGFTLYDDPRDMLLAGGGLEFHVCTVGSRQIAGFVHQPVSAEHRAALGESKPPWLDVLVTVEIADVDAPAPLIDLRILTPHEADPVECAVAAALLAVQTGEVEFFSSPSDYLVGCGSGDRMRVTLYDDEQAEEWYGRAWVDEGKGPG